MSASPGEFTGDTSRDRAVHRSVTFRRSQNPGTVTLVSQLFIQEFLDAK